MGSTSHRVGSPPTRWDVFISFRGSDTRYSFTDHLYEALQSTGIRTFMDDPELRSGEVIEDALLQAIEESKTYIVVLSKNYASSRWCLDELVAILSCYERMKRSVIAVFYKIDPSVVRHQTGRFKGAFETHQTRFDMDRLDKWRITLTNVAGLSGYHVLKNMSQADIIKKVVDRVLLEINPLTLDVAKYPVGLDSRVTAITTLLSSDKEGVIRIGIHGMGGVGKTTLAKAVYNQNYRSFHGSCFLADVRKVSRRENGLVNLQQKLIDNVLKRKNDKIDNVDQGIELIRARICSKKVLIVIDDLDNIVPLEYIVGPFAMGSIIIITTRNEDLLDSIKVEARYKVNELGDAESRQLFTQHAFGDDKIPDAFTELSQKILEHAGGLPLALKVFGSNLLNQPEEEWRWFINKLKRVPIEDVENKLMISFQALKSVDPMLQNIYLDIACFFVGHKKEEVVNIMETCYTFVNHHIDILNKRCLLTTNDEDELGMHDLLQDMGRNIARNGSPDEPEKHSRLWVSKDICDVLKKQKGTEAVECVIPRDNNQDAFNGVSFTTETFKTMSKLRFLYLERVNITGSFKQIFEDLRLLRWKYFPLQCLPPEFDPPKLVILELPDSKLRTMWKQNMVPHVFVNLKTLIMSSSRDLTSTPDFTKLPHLETLNLSGCKSLEEVHISIGSLVRLVYLYLYGCIYLKSLPYTICNLRALEVLGISDCIRLEVLPKQLGNIKSLTELNADKLTVLKLPDSIGHLMKLVELRLNVNENLKTLPNTICNLRALKILSLYGSTSLQVLPTDLGNIESLTKLIAGGLCVSELPESIGRLTKLVELDLSDNMNLETLPDSTCNLRALEILDISGCEKLEILPGQLWKLTCLRELNACGVSLLKELPDIESSETALSLQTLNLGETVLSVLPLGIRHLLNLKYLYLMNCCHLLSIPELPPNLKKIKVNRCKYMERLPNLSNLKQLEILDITDCISLTEIVGLEELTSLEELHLIGCNSSLLACIFTPRLFQTYSRFWKQINIYAQKFPDWISHSPELNIQSSNLKSNVCLNLQPNMSHNFLGMILCFKCHEDYEAYRFVYSVKTISGDFIRRCTVDTHVNFDSVMVVVPNSIFPVTNGDDRIELTVDDKIIFGIHLLYKPEIRISDEYDSTTVDKLKSVDPMLQDIFLDIACFFIGWKKEEVVNIMETCYTSVKHNIDILKERCLLTVNNRDELEMHDLFRHMARKIARNNSPANPEKHSRLWLSIDIYDVFKKHKGTEVIECIIPHNLALAGESFTTETFKSMSKLRFLYLKKVDITGSFEQIFENLKWLRWDSCPFRCLPSDFYPQKLVILELPHSNIRTMWQLNNASRVFEELKTLNMSYSRLSSTPDFTKFPSLEILNLEGCESLEEVDISIGSLLRLVSFTLRGCVKLKRLPDTICNLRTLKVLTIDSCISLEALPMKVGNIESLTKLNAYGLTVSKLPNSIRLLSKLVELNLKGNKYLENLPHTICNLRALEVLDIGGCSNLDALPTSMGNIKSLRELNAEKLAVSKLPDSIGYLSKLVNLRLSSNKDLETLPRTICNLISLEILDISGCEKLEVLPDQLWKLTRLRVLDAGGAYRIKPDSITITKVGYI